MAKRPKPDCPHCGVAVRLKTIVDCTVDEFLQFVKSGGELKPYEIWGSPQSNRVIIKSCMKDGFMHFKVNNQHRLVYFRGEQ